MIHPTNVKEWPIFWSHQCSPPPHSRVEGICTSINKKCKNAAIFPLF